MTVPNSRRRDGIKRGSFYLILPALMLKVHQNEGEDFGELLGILVHGPCMAMRLIQAAHSVG